MRGPSSSHCAGALRIGRLARELMQGSRVKHVLVEFDETGSLATTHTTQGSDMGFAGGLLGWNTTHPRMAEAEKVLLKKGVEISYVVGQYDMDHPNTYRITLCSDLEKHMITAVSSGGGMIDIISIDGFPLSIKGDFFETLIFVESVDILSEISLLLDNPDSVDVLEVKTGACFQVKTQSVLLESAVEAIGSIESVIKIKQLSPVLPIRSRRNISVPFLSCPEMLSYNSDKNLTLADLAILYESHRGDVEPEDVVARMEEIIDILIQSIAAGLEGTEHEDRILGSQSKMFARGMESGLLLGSSVLNRMTLYVSCLMEMKSSMGVIVAAPTAGSCAALPGAVLGAVDSLDFSKNDGIRGLLAAGLIGVFIATDSTFAAEVCGCQAECGAASGMAAAALTEMGGGSAVQSLAAASMALQNILGMICDPVANRVEVPCLTKNAMAAANALTCANMALAGYDPVVPLDEVIKTMDMVGKSIIPELRCTALGGLSITKSAKAIENMLDRAKTESEK